MVSESEPGALRSENAGTSNRKAGENPARRNTEVSFAMVISEGLVGPKGMPNGGPDGEQVNIPAHCYVPMEGRSVVSRAPYWIGVGVMRMFLWQIRETQVRVRSKCEASAEQILESTLPRKTSFGLSIVVPYRNPTQVVESRRLRRTSERSSRNSAKKRP